MGIGYNEGMEIHPTHHKLGWPALGECHDDHVSP